MAVRPYDENNAAYGGGASYGESTSGGVGGQIFLWIAWALAAAFWAAGLTGMVGILQAIGDPVANGPGAGEADAGGISWMLITFVGGVLILGGAIAYGTYRWATRDKSRDAATEAATHALYDITEAAGGDDEVTLSPEEHRPEDREAMRVARGEHKP